MIKCCRCCSNSKVVPLDIITSLSNFHRDCIKLMYLLLTLCVRVSKCMYVCVASRKRACHRCWHTKSDKRLLTGIAHMGNQMWLKFNRPFDRVEWLRCEAWQATTKAEERTNRWTNKATAIAAASSHRKKNIHSENPPETEQENSDCYICIRFAFPLFVSFFLLCVSLSIFPIYALPRFCLQPIYLVVNFTDPFRVLGLWINHNSSKHWMLFVLCLNFISLSTLCSTIWFYKRRSIPLDGWMGFLWLHWISGRR